MRKLAIWTPLPPLKTGIADYVAELLPYLSEDFDLEIFVDNTYQVNEELTKKYKIFPYMDYSERVKSGEYDLNIYQMGNNEYHAFIYQQALKVPGLTVLHDLSLSYMLYHHYAGVGNDLQSFRKEFSFSEGEEALAHFDRLYNLGDNMAVMDLFSDQYMLRRLVGRSYAILSHLEYCANIAKERYGARRTYSMYLGSPDPMQELPGITKQTAREQLNLSEGAFIIGVFGHLQPNKQNEVVLRALARIKSKHPHVLGTFVGDLNPALNYDSHIRELIKKLDLGQNVRLTGFVSHQDMQKYYLACDVIVNLRYPSFGQMSATLSRGIATGRPAIITDLPEWRFFPEDFCWHVPANDSSGKKISEYVTRLVENPIELEQRSKAAREFYLRVGTSRKAAENLRNSIVDVIENGPREVSLEESQATEVEQIDMLRSAFGDWDQMRAGGKLRYQFEKLRRIPVFGPMLFNVFVLSANVINVRKIRRAEWALFNAYNNSLVDLKHNKLADLGHRLARIEHNKLADIELKLADIELKLADIEPKLADIELKLAEIEPKLAEIELKLADIEPKLAEIEQKTDKHEGDIKRAEAELRDEFSFEPVRIWDDPLSSIQDYHPEQLIKQEDATGDSYYIALEQAVRGSEEIIRKRQQTVLDKIKLYFPLEKNDSIVDIGCGRGEFLSLLREEGVHPIGVEINHLLVRDLKQKGFEVHEMDMFKYLSALPDGRLKGITAFHVIEHLNHDQNMDFFSLAFRKLVTGGFIYLETPNPLCPDSWGRFYTDPTHQKPIQPFQLAFQLDYSQFNKIKLIFLEPLKTRGSLSSERWITMYQDYGILATK